MARWVWALCLAAIGHAAWDNVLHWMVLNDPDASIVHMHWLRSVILAVSLWCVGRRQPLPDKHWWWWIRFSLFGFTIPTLLYTACVAWTGYRIILGGQPFIPLLVAGVTKKDWSTRRCLALTISLTGTLSIWLFEPWNQHDDELWAVWFATLATLGHVIALTIWFSMMQEVRTHTIAAVRRGAVLNVLIMFASTVLWTPQHIQAAYMTRWDVWVLILAGGAVASGCKYWVIAMAVDTLALDTVAIFECVHPIATLAAELVHSSDVLEYTDAIALSCFVFGCILYPKANI